MGDNRNYAALDWVIGEIDNTLTQASQALEAFVDAPEDSTRMRFCLTYVHQVYGTLKMVEFFGAVLLAEEMEKLAQALVNNTVEDVPVAQEVLMRAILQLPVYLEKVKATHNDDPVYLLPILNDLRAVCNESLLTETSLFSPDLTKIPQPKRQYVDELEDEESFLNLLKKLRQMFQFSLVGVLKNKEVEDNLNYLNKVCARLHTLTEGTPQEPLWPIVLALLEGLANESISASISVKNLLRQVDGLLKKGVEKGRGELINPLPDDLMKNLLYYVARSKANSPHIQEIKQLYDLDSALPRHEDDVEHVMSGPDPDALHSVVVALLDELSHIKLVLETYGRGGESATNDELQTIIPIFKRVADTMAVLDIDALRHQIIHLGDIISEIINDGGDIEPSVLMDIATKIISIESALEALPNSLQSGRQGISTGRSESESQFNQAQESVIRESRNGLEQAKEHVIEFIASQWKCEHLETVPSLLMEVSGGLHMVSMQRAAKVLDACAQYILDKLVRSEQSPEWSTLDMLADAITSVEYFLERQSDNSVMENNLILEVAEESLALLGYDVARIQTRPATDFLPPSDEYQIDDIVDADISVQEQDSTGEDDSVENNKGASNKIDELALVNESDSSLLTEVQGSVEADVDDIIDEEIIEIFIEEAAEVLEIIADFLPRWSLDFKDEEALSEIRRAFHTLKGSGRMVGATDIGELAWVIEEMLNRIIDGTLPASTQRADFIMQAYKFIPLLVEVFEVDEPNPDPERTKILMDEGVALSLMSEKEGSDAQTSLEVAVEKISSTAVDQTSVEKSQLSEKVEAADSQSDRVLWDIFRGEAEAHVAVVDSFIQSSEALSPACQVPSDALQRALHTLKGSAHMADIVAIASIVSPLEKYIRTLRDYQIQADQSIVELLKEGVCYVNQGLERLAQYKSIDLPEAAVFIEEIASRYEKILNDTGDQSQSGSENISDPKMLVDLLQNEVDLLIDAADILDEWVAQEAVNEEQLERIVDELQKLQKSAEKAKLQPVIALAGLLEDAYLCVFNKSCQIDGEFVALLKEAHDSMLNLLDQIVASETLDFPYIVINRLTQFLEMLEAKREEELQSNIEQAVKAPVVQKVKEDKKVVVSENKSSVATSRKNNKSGVINIQKYNFDEDLDLDDEDSDVEILEIFIEEATELLESIDDAIHDWLEDKGSQLYLDDLQRFLHTLKGGARLASMSALGDLSHDFEGFLVESASNKVEYDQDYFDVLLAYHDHLVQALEKIREKIEGIMGAAKDAASVQEFMPAQSDTATSLEVEPADAVEDVMMKKAPQELVKLSADLLENLVNLAGETSISRARLEEQSSDFSFSLEEMDITISRLQEQLRRLDIETEAQVLFRLERTDSFGTEGFDPLEMDRYSNLQQLSRSLMETAFDLNDIKVTLVDKIRSTETLLVQQARINTELQESLMRARMVPFSRMIPRLRRIVRQVSTELGKQVSLELGNVEGELDRNVMERMVAPLEHMLRNAVDHGIESSERRRKLNKPAIGRVRLSLAREGGDVVITLADDGHGININQVRKKAIEQGMMATNAELSDYEIMQFILEAGFSTATKVTQISGRGVGMDIVHSEIKLLGGSVSINSREGQGTEFKVRLPFTVSVNRALMVGVGDDSYAVPLNTIEGIVRVDYYEMERYYQEDAPKFVYAGVEYDMRSMGSLIHSGKGTKLQLDSVKPLPVLLVRAGEHTVALQVDSLMGSREIVVKNIGPQFTRVDGVSGATVLGDGSVVIILDLHALIRSDASAQTSYRVELDDDFEEEEKVSTIMVVDDSVTVRKVTSRLLERNGYRVILAKDGADAMLKLQDHIPDVMLLDIEMPRMDGFEVASSMRSSGLLKDIPIIMITSRTGDKHKNRALSMGVNRYMGKPYQEAVLLQSIEALITEKEH